MAVPDPPSAFSLNGTPGDGGDRHTTRSQICSRWRGPQRGTAVTVGGSPPGAATTRLAPRYGPETDLTPTARNAPHTLCWWTNRRQRRGQLRQQLQLGRVTRARARPD